jgi:hypothetical protein
VKPAARRFDGERQSRRDGRDFFCETAIFYVHIAPQPPQADTPSRCFFAEPPPRCNILAIPPMAAKTFLSWCQMDLC